MLAESIPSSSPSMQLCAPPPLLPRTMLPPLLRDLLLREAGPGDAALPATSLLGHISPSSHPNPGMGWLFCACTETSGSPLNPGRFAQGRGAGLMPSIQAAKLSSRQAEMKSRGSSQTLNNSKHLQKQTSVPTGLQKLSPWGQVTASPCLLLLHRGSSLGYLRSA